MNRKIHLSSKNLLILTSGQNFEGKDSIEVLDNNVDVFIFGVPAPQATCGRYRAQLTVRNAPTSKSLRLINDSTRK